MRSRKVLVAIVLLMLIVPGGILVGLSSQASSGPSVTSAPSTRDIGAGQAQSGFVSFGPAGSVENPAGASLSVAGMTTTTMTTTAMLTMTESSSTSPGSGSTTLVTANQQPAGSPGAGASMSPPSSGANGSRDVEFFSNVTLLAASAPAAFAKATAIAYSAGGYVSDSLETNTSALVVMRVPAASDQDALAQLESLGTLVSLRSSSNDVTVQYTDLNATLQSLQAEQASLLTILGQSTNINATLNVESRLQGVVQQINSVQSEILQTRTLVSFATISTVIEQEAPVVALQPPSIKVTATPRAGDSPLSVTFNAITRGGEQPYIVNYNFGDGSSYEGQALIHTFVHPGRYNVTVTATDASANVTEAWALVSVSAPPATSTFGGFPNFVGGLFLQVVEGIVEVAVVVVPIAAAVLVVLFPLRRRLGTPSRRPAPESGGAAGGEGGSGTP